MLFRENEKDSQAVATAVREFTQTVKILEEQRAYGTEKSTDVR
jgi:hypothetical protein